MAVLEHRQLRPALDRCTTSRSGRRLVAGRPVWVCPCAPSLAYPRMALKPAVVAWELTGDRVDAWLAVAAAVDIDRPPGEVG